MTAPTRIQLHRTKGCRKPGGAIVVARPSYFGNPWKVGDQAPFEYGGGTIDTLERLVDVYRQYAETTSIARDARAYLVGHDLACWCPPDQPCHADVLLELANTEEATP